MWFIPNAGSLSRGPITAERAPYRLCFPASRRSIGERASLEDAVTFAYAYAESTVMSEAVPVDGAKRSGRSDGELPRFFGS